jgi:hydroxymethylpyrimidine pyrophosphatase-like HAD family hydrolase
MPHEGCDFVFSGPIYFELLPAGITKGAALAVLGEQLGITPDRILSIGDYYNDVAMLQASAVGAVPSDAPDDIKAIADLVVGPCENGAVADFIEYLEARVRLKGAEEHGSNNALNTLPGSKPSGGVLYAAAFIA